MRILRHLVFLLVLAVPVLFGLTIVTYGLLAVTPGDPVTALVDPEVAIQLGPTWVEDQREALLPPQFHYWHSKHLAWAEFADGLPRHPEFPPQG